MFCAKRSGSFSRYDLRVDAVVAAGLLLCVGTLFAQVPSEERVDAPPQKIESKETIDARLRSVGILIAQSAAARQVESSGNTEALERHRQAREAYARAGEARDREDYAGAARLISEASRFMFEAVRIASQAQALDGPQQANFKIRLESVRTLHAALRRISAEKGDPPGAAESIRSVEELMGEAQRRVDTGRQSEAEALLNKAYLLAKLAVSSMRAGDTLVRSLNFASREEEYRYELERNDAHLMFIKVLAAERGKLNDGQGLNADFLGRAAELRKEAEGAFRRGDTTAAISRLEESTRELVRAIRSLGVFIPG